MGCKSGWIRFLNRFATHPVDLVSRESGDFLTKLLLFRKDDSRQRLYQDALSGSGPGLRPLRPADRLREDTVGRYEKNVAVPATIMSGPSLCPISIFAS